MCFKLWGYNFGSLKLGYVEPDWLTKLLLEPNKYWKILLFWTPLVMDTLSFWGWRYILTHGFSPKSKNND